MTYALVLYVCGFGLALLTYTVFWLIRGRNHAI